MSRGYILVVDDDVLLAELAVAVLQPDGDETRVAHDGREALRVIEKRVPDLVLLDANMPVLDGYATAAAIRLREDGRRVPIVALTGAEGQEARDRAPAARASSRLVAAIHPRAHDQL